MRYRILGKTGLSVSALSYGASPLGSVFREIDQSEGLRTVHTAIDLGINLIDCSPYYGLTKAETVLGQALKEIPRSKYFLATKVGRYEANTFDFSAARVKKSIDESLRRLNVEYVDILQCHDIEFVPLKQIWEETLPALRDLQRAGKTRFIGITGLPLKIFKTVLDKAEADTILSYCHYHLADTTLAGILPYLEQKKMGVINASPVSMGLLTNRGAPEWHPAPQEIQRVCRAAAEYCAREGSDIAKLAMQFACAHPGIATTLVGTASSENLKKNAQWISEPLDEALLKDVQKMLGPIKDRTWPSGLPENN